MLYLFTRAQINTNAIQLSHARAKPAYTKINLGHILQVCMALFRIFIHRKCKDAVLPNDTKIYYFFQPYEKFIKTEFLSSSVGNSRGPPSPQVLSGCNKPVAVRFWKFPMVAHFHRYLSRFLHLPTTYTQNVAFYTIFTWGKPTTFSRWKYHIFAVDDKLNK